MFCFPPMSGWQHRHFSLPYECVCVCMCACFAVLRMQWSCDVRSGRGESVFDDGRSRYEGMWANDRRHGRGIETLTDGSRYSGEFVAGLRHGE